MYYYKEDGLYYILHRHRLQVALMLDVAMLDELVQAGMSSHYDGVVDTMTRLAVLCNDLKDEKGNVYIQRPNGEMVVVHAFKPGHGGSERLPRAADKA